MPLPLPQRLARSLLALSAVLLGCSILRALTGLGDERLAEWLYNGAIGAACATFVLRLFTPDPARPAFACWVGACLVWAAGSAVTAVEGASEAFSLADAFLFLINPLIFLGLFFYARSIVPRPILAARWLDALICAFSVAAAGAAFVIEAAMATVDHQTATGAVYPIGSVVLMAAMIGVLALRGWAFDRRFALFLAGASTLAATEILYRAAQAGGDPPAFGSLYDAGWIGGVLLLGVAAWQEQRPLATTPRKAEIAVPILLGGVALAILFGESMEARNDHVTISLSALAVAMLLVRMALSLALNRRLLLRSRRDAMTDSVTGLGNARRLTADLEQLAGSRATLVLLDLNGFKSYNDAFGHPAGDGLLRRIGAALHTAAGPGGRAYRIGGDEFCVLLGTDDESSPAALARAAAQRGPGYTVTAAYGSVAVPEEAGDVSTALRLADERMYRDKRAAGGRARPVVDTLLTVLGERDAELRRHAGAVAVLAEATAAELGLDPAEQGQVRLAALLHDVGVLAQPAGPPGSAGALASDGAALLTRLPELAGVARVVGAAYERWDGRGQPAGRAGEQIPLGARIVFACHAYDALTGTSASRARQEPAHALAVLARLAGSSFDPAVVRALSAVVARPERRASRAA